MVVVRCLVDSSVSDIRSDCRVFPRALKQTYTPNAASWKILILLSTVLHRPNHTHAVAHENISRDVLCFFYVLPALRSHEAIEHITPRVEANQPSSSLSIGTASSKPDMYQDSPMGVLVVSRARCRGNVEDRHSLVYSSRAKHTEVCVRNACVVPLLFDSAAVTAMPSPALPPSILFAYRSHSSTVGNNHD